MEQQAILSRVAGKYLERYRQILEEMIQGMTQADLNDSISHNFIVQMIPHHRAAIEMSENILQYTTCLPLEKIAAGIIDEQTKSIANMEAVLYECSTDTEGRGAVDRYQQQVDGILKKMFHCMRHAPCGNCLDNIFMREMVPHHRGAVELSVLALRCGVCTELQPILQAIIVSQRRGIRQMCRLLHTH